jgi:hypothetical protein
MGCTQSLKEHRTYCDTGELQFHCYMFNKIIHGPFRCFYKNGDIKFIFIKNEYCVDEYSDGDDEYLLGQLISDYYDRYDVHKFGHHGFSRLYIFNFDASLYGVITYTNTYQDRKMYDEQGSLFIHALRNYFGTQSKFYAEYNKNTLCLYLIEYKLDTNHVIHNTITAQHIIHNNYQMYAANAATFDRIIDVTIINAVRVLQQRFRRRLYKPVLLILNDVIGVEVISNIILFYIKC